MIGVTREDVKKYGCAASICCCVFVLLALVHIGIIALAYFCASNYYNLGTCQIDLANQRTLTECLLSKSEDN